MYALNEALARDRMSEARQRAEAESLSRHASAARRWARLERLAASAHARHRRQLNARSGS